MVMVFCALESFIRDRAVEVLAHFDRASVPYGKLPEPIRYASVVNTFDGLINATRYWSRADRIAEFERIVPFVNAGLVGGGYRFSEYAFGRDKSNLGHEDIKALALALGVVDPWVRIRWTAGRLGALLTNNADIEYKTLAANRHKSAHVAGYVIDHPTVSSAVPVSIGIAIGFDICASVAVRRLNGFGVIPGQPVVNDSDIKLRFVERHPRRSNCWMVKGENATRASALGVDPEILFSTSVASARAAIESLVQKDGSGRPAKWVGVLD